MQSHHLFPDLDSRKLEERRFHDVLRSTYEKDQKAYAKFTANKKYYSITQASTSYVDHLLQQFAPGKDVLDYGCGGGHYSLALAKYARRVTGVDISPDSVEECRGRAIAAGVDGTVSFEVGDCEHLPFDDASFDLVVESGVLHHLELGQAYREVARVLKPGGRAIFVEAVLHNPFFQAYRRLTPQLRTKWESQHILGRHELLAASSHFSDISMRFFHLAGLLAVPLRGTPIFRPVLNVLNVVDRWLLALPGVRWWAWQVVVVAGRPRPEGELG
jgi:SAM-dependent methyltransferase